MTHTRVHTTITFANPYLSCVECEQPVYGYHDWERCGCSEDNDQGMLQPCGHVADMFSREEWSPGE